MSSLHLHRVPHLALAALILCVGSATAATRLAAAFQEPAQPGASEPSPEARRRWQELSPAERELLRERYGEFQRLDPRRRAELVTRLESLLKLRREAEERVPEALRQKLEKLSPEERHEVLRDYFRIEFQNRGERIREKLPEEWRLRLENTDPQERARLLRELSEQRRRSEAPRVIEHLGRSLRLRPGEVERLKALPPEQQLRAIEDLRRMELDRRGPPPGLPPEEWQRWRELPAPELLERWHRHEPGFGRFERPPGEPGRGPRESRGNPRRGRHGGDRPPHRDGFPPPEGMPPPPNERARSAEQLSPESSRELLHALRPDPQWVIELAELPSEQRREQIAERCRERALSVLEGLPEIEREKLEALRALRGGEFFEAMKPLLGGFAPRRGHEKRPPRGPECPEGPEGGPPPPTGGSRPI